MAIIKQLSVKDLTVDLKNYRTIEQKSELDAIRAMITISPDYFWGLMESLLDDGYLPTENILVIERKFGTHDVKEGNRRIAALKIILGIIEGNAVGLPPKLIDRIKALPKEWLEINSAVPCTIYKEDESSIVDKIVTLTHGKGQKAGRKPWEAIARARHNRDANNSSEPALDLLEKYFIHGTNITEEQKVRWAGNYPITVLDEAIKKIASRFGVSSSPELAKKYPTISHKKPLDEIVYAIGMELLSFPAIRGTADFAARFGVPPIVLENDDSTTTQNSGSGKSPEPENKNNHQEGSNSTKNTSNNEPPDNPTSNTNTTSRNTSQDDASSKDKTSTTSINDERTVKKLLRNLKLFGTNRAKIEALRKEMIKLKLKENPVAFCFLLRSIFEISAKVYCEENANNPGAPSMTKQGKDKSLAEALRGICSYLTQNESDKEMLKHLHGALTELSNPNSLLSVTSMNQLVHNPLFSISPPDISTRFTNIFPLLNQLHK